MSNKQRRKLFGILFSLWVSSLLAGMIIGHMISPQYDSPGGVELLRQRIVEAAVGNEWSVNYRQTTHEIRYRCEIEDFIYNTSTAELMRTPYVNDAASTTLGQFSGFVTRNRLNVPEAMSLLLGSLETYSLKKTMISTTTYFKNVPRSSRATAAVFAGVSALSGVAVGVAIAYSDDFSCGIRQISEALKDKVFWAGVANIVDVESRKRWPDVFNGTGWRKTLRGLMPATPDANGQPK
jgi:hypothetical protein